MSCESGIYCCLPRVAPRRLDLNRRNQVPLPRQLRRRRNHMLPGKTSGEYAETDICKTCHLSVPLIARETSYLRVSRQKRQPCR